MDEATTQRAVRILAAAKINLTLNVLGRRADGFHLLDSLVVFAGIGDVLEIVPADRFDLRIQGAFGAALGPMEDNLVYKAAHGLAALAGRAPDVRIKLEKNLPVAAGIGGGSSDAAATLRALMALWQAPIDQVGLDRLALGLGADVPVCLHARPVFMSGIGEAMGPAPALPAAHLVLVNPALPLSSADVFAGRSGPYSTASRLIAAPDDVAALAAWLRQTGNDLTDSACALAPPVSLVLARIAASQGCLLARMSGSGPTCFGLFATADAAHRAADRIADEAPHWWCRAAPVLAAPPPVTPLGD